MELIFEEVAIKCCIWSIIMLHISSIPFSDLLDRPFVWNKPLNKIQQLRSCLLKWKNRLIIDIASLVTHMHWCYKKNSCNTTNRNGLCRQRKQPKKTKNYSLWSSGSSHGSLPSSSLNLPNHVSTNAPLAILRTKTWHIIDSQLKKRSLYINRSSKWVRLLQRGLWRRGGFTSIIEAPSKNACCNEGFKAISITKAKMQ